MDNTVVDTLAAAESNETKATKLSKVSATVAVTGKVNKSAHTIVAAFLLSDYVAAYGSIKAQKMLPELMGNFINDCFKARAKNIQLALAKKKVLAQHRAEWENKIDL